MHPVKTTQEGILYLPDLLHLLDVVPVKELVDQYRRWMQPLKAL